MFRSSGPRSTARPTGTPPSIGCKGQADIDLNATGRAQATRNGRKLAELIDDPAAFDFVANPLVRTRETMELLRTAMGLGRATTAPTSAVEVHFGDWQGYTLAELDRISPGATAAREADKWNFVPPGKDAESYEMLARRVLPWFEELSRPTVVTHGGIFHVLFPDGRQEAEERSRRAGHRPRPRAALRG